MSIESIIKSISCFQPRDDNEAALVKALASLVAERHTNGAVSGRRHRKLSFVSIARLAGLSRNTINCENCLYPEARGLAYDAMKILANQDVSIELEVLKVDNERLEAKIRLMESVIANHLTSTWRAAEDFSHQGGGGEGWTPSVLRDANQFFIK